MMKAAWPVLQPNVLVLDTRKAILDMASLIRDLGDRCGHAGAMHWLEAVGQDAGRTRRIPHLVLILRPEEHQGRSLCADEVEAAALLFEYRIFGLRTGALATADAMGFSSVIAEPGHGAGMAAIAARALLQRGADIVLASCLDDGEDDPTLLFSGLPRLLSGTRQRTAKVVEAAGRGTTVVDLVLRRKGLRAAALRWAAGFFVDPHSVLGRTNFLASTLRDPKLEWTAGSPRRRPVRPALGKAASHRTA